MKTIKSLFLVLFVLSFTSLQAQDYCMTAPVGYGAATTGGGTPNASNTVTVTTKSALASALIGTKSVIIVSGTIDCAGAMIKAKVINKTIIGLPGARIKNLTQTASGSGSIYLQNGSTNVIIRNIIFEGPGAFDEDGNDNLCADGCTKLWVDHCEFQDGMDGNFDNKGLTDNVTVSWCKFTYLKAPRAGGSGGTNDHRFTNLVGSDATDAPADGKYNITWQYCWWATGCVERMTRARNAQLHFLNCYWNSTVAKCNLGLENALAYVENSTFTSSSSVIYKSYGGTINLKFAGCTGSVPGNVGTATAPTYTYTALAGTQTVSAVTNATCGAGATLSVAADGTVSTPCTNTPTLVLTSGNTSQSVTANSAITNIVYTYGGSATTCTNSGLPSGVTASVNTTNKTVTIAGTPTIAGSYTYTISTTPAGVALSGTITVAAAVPPTLSLTSGTATQTAYVGNPIAQLVYTYGGGATNVTASNLPTGVTAVVDAVDKTITISGTPTVGGAKTVTITTVGGSGAAVSLTNTITVNTTTTLAIPTGISATPTATSATVNWTPVANATGYTLYVCDVPSGSGDKILFHETFNSCTVGNVVYDNASKYVAVKNSATCTEVGTIRLTNSIIKFTGLNLTGLADAKIYVKYKTTTLASAAVKINDESGSSTNYIYKFTANAAYFTNDDVVEQTVTVSGTDYVAIRSDSGSDIIIDEIKIYIPGGGAGSPTCTEYPISGGSTSSYTVSGLTPGTTYNYQLKATSSNIAYLGSAYSTASSFVANGAITPINATLSLTSAAGTNIQSKVSGVAITTITYNYSGSAISVAWTGTANATTPPAGISVSNSASTLTITGTPSAAGTFGYSVTASGTNGGTNTSLTGTLTVTNPTPLSNPSIPSATINTTSIGLGWASVPNATGYIINWCTTTAGGVISRQWDFTGSWSISGANADANLSLDTNTDRFNYVPSTTDASLVTAGGSPIADVADLKFTQAGATKLRLGFGPTTKQVYLNGAGLVVGIPCQLGDTVTIVGPSGNATAIDRGYSVTGGTLVASKCNNVNASGIMNVAAAIGSWVYVATSTSVKITTVVGGMNIKTITITSPSAGPTCTEIPVTGTSYTFTGLTNNTTYSYQIKAVSTNPLYGESSYTAVQNVTTGTPTSSCSAKLDLRIIQTANELVVNDVDVNGIQVVSMQGIVVASSIASQSVAIGNLQPGIYVAMINSKEGNICKKIIIK